MASSIIHLAIVSELEKSTRFSNVERLRLGSILPDAICAGKNGHLKIFICGNNKKTYDLETYREKFMNLMLADDLYLGYYLHILQDLVFRKFIYTEYHWNSRIPGNVEKLYRDYLISNCHVIETYGLKETMISSVDLTGERIQELGDFDVDKLMKNFHYYFIPVDFSDTFFFTKEIADEFIKRAVPICLNELNNLRNGNKLFDSYAWSWDNMPKSLLETTLNTRDLGGYRCVTDGTYLKQHRILRSDVQSNPSENDINFLKSNEIRTIIDLRNEEEALLKPSGFKKLDGFTYISAPIEEGSGIPESVDAVSASYLNIAEAKNMPLVFKSIANATSGVMINCSAGKDRTGVVSAILLTLCGVSKEDVISDYMVTKICNQECFQLIHKNYPEIDMNIVTPNERYMREFLQLLEQYYGDAKNFLHTIGVSDQEIASVIAKLK